MNHDDVQEVLRQTLDDRRLSRTEKRALKDVLADAISSDHDVALYRSTAFALARESFNDVTANDVIDWLEEVVKLLQSKEMHQSTRAETHFSPGDNCPSRIGGLFATAKTSANICVFTITDDRITNAIIEAHQRGLQIRIITDNEKAFDAGSDITRLERHGIDVRVDRSPYHMHHKFAVFDDELLLTGSYNWTRGAAENNQENFLVTDERRLVTQFGNMFERLWEQFV